MSRQPGDEELKQKIIRELGKSLYPLRALDIARAVKSTKKDVNRVLTHSMQKEAQKKNPGLNPPLWGLVDQSPITSSVPSHASSSSGAVGGSNPPPPQSSPRSRQSSGRGSIDGRELFSKKVGDDGSYTFTPVSAPVSGAQISPQQSSASEQTSPQQQRNDNLPTGVSETGYDSTIKLQPTNHTSVAAVNSPLSSTQDKKKIKPKRGIAASFKGVEEISRESSADTQNLSREVRRHIAQETESADEGHIQQEGEPPADEHITQERLAEEMSSLTVNNSSLAFDPPVDCRDERVPR